MKKTLKLTVSGLIIAISMSLLIMTASDNSRAVMQQNPDLQQQSSDLRGVWVATVLNIDYPAHPVTDPEVLKSEALKILDNAAAMGFNAVFLQVRPASDAFYKSSYYPWSEYLTGSQGLAPDGGFDPLEFWVSEAHKRGIQLHAWINPYRITKELNSDPDYDFASLAPSNPAVLHPDWVVKYSDGNLYFNPGIPEVRKLIIDSALEIVENYEVDGIHFDDYFYPGQDFDDKATFAKYGSAYSNIGDWRRANVNTLISDLSHAIKATGKSVRFGISPFGIWANKKSNPMGSDTSGMESYYDHYADTRKWVKEGMIDYIAPQLYWNIGYTAADYNKLLNWWKDTVKGTGVDLYIGQAAYKAGNFDCSSPWYGVSEIAKQMELNKKASEVKGSIFFNYSTLADYSALTAVIKAVYEQQDGLTAAIPADLARPQNNISTNFESFYLNGSSDPDKPLYLNGQLVENRSEKGYFGVLVPLVEGANVFTVSQEASYSTRAIYRIPAVPKPQKMSAVEIPSSSVFPQSQEYRTAGEKITLTCKAPIGSKVTVKLGGKTYNMKPATTVSPGPDAYPTTFSCTYKVPAYKGTPRNIDLGAPVYTMKYKGIVKTRKAPAKIGVIMKNSPYYAEATKDVIDTYIAPETGNGANYELYKGMTDYVTGMTGSYVRLSSGEWVGKSSVKLYTSKTQFKAVVSKAAYIAGDSWDTLKLDVSKPAAALASFDGKSMKVNISAASSAKLPVLPGASLFSKAAVSTAGGRAVYTLTLKPGQRIEGYYIEKTKSGLTLHIKRRVAPDAGGTLSGITVMIDPGHGGSETGTYGPLGLDYPEKTINLQTALKLKSELESLGAKVLMTRTSDITLSLADRLAASRKAKPDMFISVHANAMEDNIDISKTYGFSAFYREALARPLCDAVYNNVLNTLNRNAKGMDKKNFYVMRGTWTPSILVETGFVPNPDEFEFLTDEAGQSSMARSLAEAISQYFNS